MTIGPFTAIEGGIIAAPAPNDERLARIETKLDYLIGEYDRRLNRIESAMDKGARGLTSLWIGGGIVSLIGCVHNIRASITNWLSQEFHVK